MATCKTLQIVKQLHHSDLRILKTKQKNKNKRPRIALYIT